MGMLAQRGEKGFLVILCLLLVLFMEMTSIIASKNDPYHQNLEVESQLKLLNKPAVKSIKSPDGDIIDCIKITDQPALDHPLLKNHTIQMAPKSYPKYLFGHKNVSYKMKIAKTQLWQQNGSCPKGTIPVRRVKEEDLLRATSIKDFGKKKHGIIPQPRHAGPNVIEQVNYEHAVAYVSGEMYYGGKACINVWQPDVQRAEEFSSSAVSIVGGTFGDDVNTIEAGWQVYPHLYGDYNTRFTISWTRDGHQSTGCYNLLCSGFVQINEDIALGSTISPTSRYDSSQYGIIVLIWKDPEGGDWWMQLNDEYVGYWPASLFNHLVDSASFIGWGGAIIDLGRSKGPHTSTHMGNGQWPQGGYGKASFFESLLIVDGSTTLRPPDRISSMATDFGCYDISDIQLDEAGDWGNYFYYGGPGRSDTCT